VSPKRQIVNHELDSSYAYQQFGFVQVSSAALAAHQQLYLDITIHTGGYLYTYVANESNVSASTSVYFDDFNIIHTRNTSTLQVVQTTDYYPFGLAMAAQSYQKQSTLDNDYKFNGIEEQDEFDLNIYAAFYRNLDPSLGRWWQIDPKSEEYHSWTPYNSMGDNPIGIMDPLGDEWLDKVKDKAKATKISNDLDLANATLVRDNAKLQKRIGRAEQKGNQDKAEKLTMSQVNNNISIIINDNSKNNLVKMEASNVKFTFNLSSSGSGGQTRLDNKIGAVVIEAIESSLGNMVHEVQHGADIGTGKNRMPIFGGMPSLSTDEEERYEKRGYMAQVAADRSSMPSSNLDKTPRNPRGVTGPYVGGIDDGKTYPRIYRKYKKIRSKIS